MSRLRSSLLLGAFAGTACANIYGVGELTSGTEQAGAAGAAGSRQAPSLAGAKANAGSGGSVAAGAGPVGNGGSAAISGTGSTFSSAGVAGAAGDSGEPPPSCAELPAMCGSSDSATRDCCASFEVPGGTFFRSYDALPDAGWDDPSSPAHISTFRLDAYEVTVGRFRNFVAAYPWLPRAGAGKNPENSQDFGWSTTWNALLPRDAEALSVALTNCGAVGGAEPSPSTWTVLPDANEALPINCLTWFEAFAFCAWDGGRLPSEAEWNYAAAGGREARVYPWASSDATDVDANHAVYQSPIAKVGSKSPGNGRFGHADLAGNVWEWNVDWYRGTYSVPCDDCAELASDVDTSDRVLRGGAYYNEPPYLRVAARGNAAPSVRDSGYGVRCARVAGSGY